MTAAVLASGGEGRRHVLALRPLYGGTDHLLASGTLGVEVEFCDEDDIARLVRPDTALVIVESPANPTLELVDIAYVVAQAGGVPVLVDNTFATPVLQNPLDLGARMSLHSATKYLGGHGDVVGGVIACDEETAAALRQGPGDHRRSAPPSRRLPAASRPEHAADPSSDPAGERPRRRCATGRAPGRRARLLPTPERPTPEGCSPASSGGPAR